MKNFSENVNAFFKARTWSGAVWLMNLCVILVIVAGVYILAHKGSEKGKEYIQLNSEQIQSLNNLLSVYADTGKTSPITETVIRSRQPRDQAVIDFLQSEYRGKIDRLQEQELRKVIVKFDNKDVGNYLTHKKIMIKSYFWLIGSDVYLEAWLWSLIGVLVSLIYYVSIAQSKSLNIAGDDDTGKFDPAELPSQIAKMFYAPACTIVIVLGYHFLSGSNENMIDISVNKGLIIFSFISGFFSGRLMKFLDKLKDLLLPSSEKNSPETPAPKTSSSVQVQLKLSDSLTQSPNGAAIIEAGFNAATVTLTPEAGGDEIKLENPEDDQADLFIGKEITAGKYILNAALTFKQDDVTVINMAGKQPVEVKADNNEFTLVLDKTDTDG